MKKITTFITAFLCILGLSLSPAHAKDCKGLSKTQCTSDNSCSWVNGYKRKDGVKVKSFCRTSAKKKKQTTNKKSTKKTDTKKTSDKKSTKKKDTKKDKKVKKKETQTTQ